MLLPYERSLQPSLVSVGLIVSVAGLVASRNPDPSPSTEYPATASAKEADLQGHGPPDFCRAVSFGAKYSQGPDHCDAGDSHPLASCRIQVVLALEVKISF